MDRLRAGAEQCPSLARLLGYLDDPERDRAKLREAIKYHLREAHPDCPGNNHRCGTCRATGAGGYLRCLLPAGHDGAHESRMMIWTEGQA